MAIRVIVCGAKGRMGKVSCDAIADAPDMELVAMIDRGDSLALALERHKPDAVVDFTIPTCVFENAQCCIEYGVSPVVGATGLSAEQIIQLERMCAKRKLGALIAPNFSLGAILMMEAATKIASYMPHAEIIEMHHDQKVDSPSGTALKTAAMMAPYTKDQTIPFSKQPSRGKPVDGIAIHSVRLPGLFAHQMVIFGGEGETLTIRHDSTDRRAMMPGLLLALRKVGQLAHLVYGLEHLLKEK
jgi:4-hydroxy-tetrahydrodipicolinate reductase